MGSFRAVLILASPLSMDFSGVADFANVGGDLCIPAGGRVQLARLAKNREIVVFRTQIDTIGVNVVHQLQEAR
jgi:hypothetical protein